MFSSRSRKFSLRVRQPVFAAVHARPGIARRVALLCIIDFAFCGLFLWSAAGHGPVLDRAVFLCTAAGFLLVLPAGVAVILDSTPGRLRVDSGAPLRFRPPRGSRIALFGVGLFALAVSVLALLAGAERLARGESVLSNRYLIAQVPLGLGIFLWQVIGLWKKPGAWLEARGLSQGRIGSTWTLEWEDIARVLPMARKRGVRLALEDTAGGIHFLYSERLGSDPLIVAEVIEYFRTHPAERAVLNDPLAALALVGEVSAV